MKLFLSYSSANYSDVAQLQQALKTLGHDVWFAPERIYGGQCFAAEISRALKSSEALLLYATQSSVGNHKCEGSNEVKTELKIARESGMQILPLEVDGSLESGAGEGFDYLLKNYQWISLEAPLLAGQFDLAAKLIHDYLSKAPTNEGVILEQLKPIEQLLKDKQGKSALQLLNKIRLPSQFKDEITLLKVIATLQSVSLKMLSKHDADKVTSILLPLGIHQGSATALYLLAIISEHYYQKNCIANPTPGFCELRKLSAQSGRLKAKYIKMTNQLIPNYSSFLTRWR